jgi:hypothetical protein
MLIKLSLKKTEGAALQALGGVFCIRVILNLKWCARRLWTDLSDSLQGPAATTVNTVMWLRISADERGGQAGKTYRGPAMSRIFIGKGKVPPTTDHEGLEGE